MSNSVQAQPDPNDILQLAQQHGAERIRVVGSAARGEASSASDIDFLVAFPPATNIFTVVGFWMTLTDLLELEVDVLVESALDAGMGQRDCKKPLAYEAVRRPSP
jgi:predicted nucleotidyltransferase